MKRKMARSGGPNGRGDVRSGCLAMMVMTGLAIGPAASAQPAAVESSRPPRAAAIARLAPDAPMWLERADTALARRQAGAAREALERAETAFLNGRLRGERGMTRPLAAITAARSALDRGDHAGARAAIQPLLAVTGRAR